MNTSHLIMPESVVLDEANYSNTFGKFTLQPLERGFGVTLGNSLRRGTSFISAGCCNYFG